MAIITSSSTDLSNNQISELSVSGPERVEKLMTAEDAARAEERVYQGDPGFLSETE